MEMRGTSLVKRRWREGRAEGSAYAGAQRYGREG